MKIKLSQLRKLIREEVSKAARLREVGHVPWIGFEGPKDPIIPSEQENEKYKEFTSGTDFAMWLISTKHVGDVVARKDRQPMELLDYEGDIQFIDDEDGEKAYLVTDGVQTHEASIATAAGGDNTLYLNFIKKTITPAQQRARDKYVSAPRQKSN